MRHHLPPHVRRALAGVMLGSLLGTAAAAALTPTDITISQKNRQFDPGSVTLAKDRALDILNDDGGLVHHAYIESETFNFDSGDQNPGSRTRIVFPVRGDFLVLCGIHPKMKLIVHVD